MSGRSDDTRDQKSPHPQLVHAEEWHLRCEEVFLTTEVISDACGWAGGWVTDQRCYITTREGFSVTNRRGLGLTSCSPMDAHA